MEIPDNTFFDNSDIIGEIEYSYLYWGGKNGDAKVNFRFDLMTNQFVTLWINDKKYIENYKDIS